MKFNKWTLGLAAVGAVSLASAARADEAKLSQVQTALSNTTISGYVSSSMNWQISGQEKGDSDAIPTNLPLQGGKQDGFNLDVVKLSISKPQDESEWASGYQVDLLFGPDAVNYDLATGANGVSSNPSDFGILQAYIMLRTPVGNGIDWKVGQFNTVVGYESFDAGSNPNYTRSWGWAVEPTTHTGILGSYKVSDELSLSLGVANTLSGGINTRNTEANGSTEGRDSAWKKTILASAAFTTPSSWGWAAGSSFYAGMVYGFAANNTGYNPQGGNQVNYYAGVTLNTPCKALTTGLSFDYVQNVGGITQSGSSHMNDYIVGLYATFKATDKLSFSARGEYFEEDLVGGNGNFSSNGAELTGTVQYDLWANVISRLEVRWDHVIDSNNGNYLLPTSGSNTIDAEERTAVGLYANLIYKF
jgi:hypothetical protein